MPKKITLEDLALMVKKGFDHAASKEDLKAVELRLDKRIDNLETRFDSLEARFDLLETKVDGLETKVDTLEIKMDGLKTSFDSHLSLSDKRYLELKHKTF